MTGYHCESATCPNHGGCDRFKTDKTPENREMFADFWEKLEPKCQYFVKKTEIKK